MKQETFYDETPFEYGYSSKQEIIANMNPLLKRLMEKNAGKVFYDIGCGCGRNLVYASKYASKVIGVDLSAKSLSFAKNQWGCSLSGVFYACIIYLLNQLYL